MQDIFTKYRGWIIFLMVLPASFLYQLGSNLKRKFSPTGRSAQKQHKRKVDHIQRKVKEAYSAGMPMCTARPSWKTMSIRKATYKDNLAKIPVNLHHILSLDRERMLLEVEPQVTMREITQYLVPRGFALAVQVEMDDLTVGGLCMGIGIETTSHRKGFLFESVRSYELITARGEILEVTAQNHPELFHTLPMSHGTVGFLTKVSLEVVPIPRYMELTYHPCHDLEVFCETLEKYSTAQEPPAYLEAILFSHNSGVVMTGTPVDRASGKVNAINRWHKPLFHLHVAKFLTKGTSSEYIPMRHYFHRHTPSIFFQIRDLIPFANQKWYRWLFAWMGAPKVSLMKFSMTKALRRRALHNRVAQDILIPLTSLQEALHLAEKKFAIYPIWVCPVKLFKHKHQGLIRFPKHVSEDSCMFVDVGIYGIPPSVKEGRYDAIRTARVLEAFTREQGGFQMLYADIFMNRYEFEDMFDHKLYRQVRGAYGANKSLPEVYEKVIPEKWLIDVENRMVNKHQAAETEKDQAFIK